MTAETTIVSSQLSTQYSVLSTSPAPWTLLIDDAPRPGWHNMAIDQALLDSAERNGTIFFRLYRWGPPCLSFGRHEPAVRRYDRERIQALGLDTVRRPTGGRAVWHDRELTYAFTGPIASVGSLTSGFRRIHSVLVAAVQALGVEATLADPVVRAPMLDAGACFARAVGGEVVVNGLKLVGSAQRRQGSAVLQHGSLLLDGDQTMVARVTRGTVPPESRCVSLAAVLGRSIDFTEVAGEVIGALREWLGPETQTGDAWPMECEDGARFRDEEWTWSR